MDRDKLKEWSAKLRDSLFDLYEQLVSEDDRINEQVLAEKFRLTNTLDYIFELEMGKTDRENDLLEGLVRAYNKLERTKDTEDLKDKLMKLESDMGFYFFDMECKSIKQRSQKSEDKN